MKRRNFILLSATGFAAIAVPSLVLQSCAIEYDKSLALSQQLAYIWDKETMITVGKEYQKKYPKENSEQKLAKLLLKDISNEEGILMTTEQKIIADYKDDNTVLLDGWILSVTEGRQCALFSITQSN